MERAVERKRGYDPEANAADWLNRFIEQEEPRKRTRRDYLSRWNEFSSQRLPHNLTYKLSLDRMPTPGEETTGVLHSVPRLVAVQVSDKRMREPTFFSGFYFDVGTMPEASWPSMPTWHAESDWYFSTIQNIIKRREREVPKCSQADHELVLKALNNPKHKWRTVPGIAEETGLDPETVTMALKQSGDQVVRSSRYTSDGRELYTTRVRFREFASPWTKVVGALKNRID